MTDETAAQPGAEAEKPPLVLQIRGQFVRQLQFVNHAVLQQLAAQPNVTININVEAQRREDNHFAVHLRTEVKAASETQKIYDLMLDYGGLFRIENHDPRSLEPLLLIECPRLIFPFARRIIADAVRDGGYTPLMLDPVDFVALYRNEQARRAAQQSEETAPPQLDS